MLQRVMNDDEGGGCAGGLLEDRGNWGTRNVHGSRFVTMRKVRRASDNKADVRTGLVKCDVERTSVNVDTALCTIASQ